MNRRGGGLSLNMSYYNVTHKKTRNAYRATLTGELDVFIPYEVIH